MSQIHIILDLETWGTAPGSDIRSIGACVMQPENGYVAMPDSAYNGTKGTFYIACDNPHNGIDTMRRYPLTRNPATVKWWSEQSDEAQAAFADPVDLGAALEAFRDWLEPLQYGANAEGGSLRIWSHGAAFDPPILAAAYEAVGLPVPWHYRAPRDTRTLFDTADIDDHSAWLKQHPGPLGVPHHALDDAICQARAVCAAMARISVSGWEL